eukprot:TRINITY_DN445_c0_g1_i2.p1 TRINITY_DN445_c0_g1~~TRINITY_DN445_c0_g1_i2.p1  ORF type:complete len:172 (-),score=43.18 TRINITY_DN445_c0_g1_i2:47-562(-)
MYTVRAVLLLDAQGERIVAKYYTPPNEEPIWGTKDVQIQFEKLLRQKAQPEAQILMLNECVAVFREVGDMIIFVIGDKNENELILDSVVSCLYDSLSSILKEAPSKMSLLDNYNIDYVLLMVDEVVDGGIILESDPVIVCERLAVRSQGEAGGVDRAFGSVIRGVVEVIST